MLITLPIYFYRVIIQAINKKINIIINFYMDKNELWQAALGELELSLSKANFMTWFKNTFIVSYDDVHIIIGVPNTFTKAWFEKKYHPIILKCLQKISDNRIRDVAYQVEMIKNTPKYNVPEEKLIQEKEYAVPMKQNIHEIGLNPRYTFNSFVIGKANELAHAACVAVSQDPGHAYNPLYIYGGVGLGKTHLLQAIGNKIIDDNPGKKVLYISSEKFTNDFIKSISSKIVDKFRAIYRSVDILLIDDVQFFAGKEGTQEEFFHTFNALHQNNKQMVITSDKPPKSIPSLENRLVSRFEWGMLADISSPDLETRIAILNTKCKEKNINLSQEIVNYIAANIQNNIRELEGALNRIIAHLQLDINAPILEIAKKIIQANSSSSQKKSITPKTIIQIVSDFFDIKIEDLLGACRKKNLALPRQIIMFLMREEIKSSYPFIGQEIGNRDHTTAMYAYLKIKESMNNDDKLRQNIDSIRQKIYS